MTDANEALTEDTVMGILYAAKLHNERGFCREEWKDGIDVTRPSYALMRFVEAIRAHLTDPGYVRVPVEPTARMLTAGYSARKEILKLFALGGSLLPADDGMKSAYYAMIDEATKETSHD